MSRSLSGLFLVLISMLAGPVAAQTHAPLVDNDVNRRAIPVVDLAAAPSPAPAENAAVLGSQPDAVAASSASTAVSATRQGFGDATRNLITMQAEGRAAGAELPMLGPVSTASWNRYLGSFSMPIPQWFAEKVKTEQ
ncbi:MULTISPECIES: DUF3613 domain-containing protein [unclassified Bordetella]|uniref:DUF3613 domain-containing protein n=1 Tax=unclassified Bordetella TaxID=2630031 RepID=UPI0013270162|nr:MULTISPECIES: DUF3613 domain-containing protein [unclassified Bordetella]MVW70573.1 DUF3613 domain-containing protein [Bordetella sp. 15P40C-2]MVW79781.1 DUF3613 domain-containing protein [Bordetella sp. 02P26C-1]